MLLRRDEHGVLAIGQPSHAWVSGQLARAWGNERFGAVQPWEQVCLGAEQHDIGMAAWDLEPSFNAETGLPHAFTEMPVAVHLPLWQAAAPRLIRQSRYAALLCSLHGVRLYRMRDLAKLPAGDADAVRAFFAEQRALQDRLAESLGADPAEIERNSDLIWTWDYMSLALCLSWPPCTARAVPAADGAVDVELLPGETATQVLLDPWPFAAADGISVSCEGQRLQPRYESENELRTGLAEASWETLTLELVPARSA